MVPGPLGSVPELVHLGFAGLGLLDADDVVIRVQDIPGGRGPRGDVGGENGAGSSPPIPAAMRGAGPAGLPARSTA